LENLTGLSFAIFDYKSCYFCLYSITSLGEKKWNGSQANIPHLTTTTCESEFENNFKKI